MTKQNKRFFEFDDFKIDTVNRRLLRGGEVVPLKAKAVETLLILLEHKGDVVEKDDLMNRLWADSFVEESNLTQNIYTLRKALGEDYIETIPRRGYRFSAEVNEWEDANSDQTILVHEKTRMSVTYEEETEETAVIRESPLAIAEPRRAREKHLWLGVAGLSIVVILLAGFLWIRSSKTPFENAKLAKLTTTGDILKAAVSPDGKYLAYVSSEETRQSLSIRQIATGRDLQIAAPAKTDFYGLTFSHDGEYLYFVNQEMNRVGMLFRVPILGGEPVKLAEDVDSPVTFSPDDKYLAFVRGNTLDHAIYIAQADGTQERKLVAASLKNDSFVLAPEWKVPPAWSPDGKTIVCDVGIAGPDGNYETVWGFDAENGASRPFTSQRWEIVGRPEWLPDGSGVMMPAAELGTGRMQQVWYVEDSGAARKVTNDLSDYRDLSINRDGKTLVAVQLERKANLNLASTDELDRLTQITSANYDGLGGIAWTPDERVVFTRRTTAGQNLWIMDLAGGEPRALTSRLGFIVEPVVSPDGRYIVFSSNHDGRSHIWRVDIDGRNALELTRGTDDLDPTITPDSRSVIFTCRIGGRGNICRVGIDGGEPESIFDKISFEPMVSPDGQTLALGYRPAPADLNQLALMPIAGGELRLICELPAYYGRYFWMPDGQALSYADRQNPLGNIWIQPIDGSPRKQLTFWKPDPIFSFGWSKDGKRIAAAIGTQTSDAVSIGDLGQ